MHDYNILVTDTPTPFMTTIGCGLSKVLGDAPESILSPLFFVYS